MGRSFKQPRVHKIDLVAHHGLQRPIRVILHSTEGPAGSGVNVPNYWRGQGSGYGTQLIIDSDGYTVRAVSDTQVCYGTQDRNTGSLQIEQVGFSSMTRQEWTDRRMQLKQVAKWLAYWSRKYGIPLVLDVNRGVSTHAMQSAAFTPGGHTDPGPNYPLTLVMRRARWYRRFGWLLNPND